MVYIVLILVVLIVFGVFGAIQRRKINKEYENFKERLDFFKERADQIQIDLNELSLKSNEWQEELVTNNSLNAGYNQLAGRGDLNTKTVQHNLNVLEADVLYKGRAIKVISHVNMDVASLKMQLALKEETTLYVNPEDPEDYYLDLEFLYS